MHGFYGKVLDANTVANWICDLDHFLSLACTFCLPCCIQQCLRLFSVYVVDLGERNPLWDWAGITDLLMCKCAWGSSVQPQRTGINRLWETDGHKRQTRCLTDGGKGEGKKNCSVTITSIRRMIFKLVLEWMRMRMRKGTSNSMFVWERLALQSATVLRPGCHALIFFKECLFSGGQSETIQQKN